MTVPALLLFSTGAHGQATQPVEMAAGQRIASPSQQSQGAKVLPQTAPTINVTANDLTKPAANAELALKELSSYYEREAEKIAEQNRKLKELYNDGLIARVEMEASDKALVEARAKVEEIHTQIIAQPVLAAELPEPAPLTTVWSTGNKKIDDLISNQGKLYGVDSYLIYCVMSQESSFKSGAISLKGAQGLMQLMPATAARYGVANPFDPAQSIRGGTRYLKDLLRLFDGRVDLVLAAYNAGEGTVMKYGNRVPPYAETQSYVRLISKRYLKKSGT